MRGWYLARTRPQSEYRAAAALERNGYELFFPRVRTPRPRSGHVDAPLFPGYLFVRQDVNGSGLPPIDRIAGLLGWVQFDGVVPRLPDTEIHELGLRLSAINKRGGAWRQYRPGERVRVNWGSTDSLAQVLEEAKSPRARVRVLLSMMGRSVPASVPWHDIQPIENGSLIETEVRGPRRTRGRGRWVNGFGPKATASRPAIAS